MDGAIILAPDASRIARANVHLVPTRTSPPPRPGPGTARPSGWPAPSTCPSSPSRRTWRSSPSTAATRSTPCRAIPRLLGRANQALQTLERYRDRLDAVTSRPVGARGRGSGHRPRRGHRPPAGRDGPPHRRGDRGLHRRARRRRPAGPPAARGADGRRRGRPPARGPGLPPGPARRPRCGDRRRPLGSLSTERLLDLKAVAGVPASCRRAPTSTPASSPAGYRLLAKIPRLPEVGHRGDRRALRQPAEGHAGHRRGPRRAWTGSSRPGPGPSRRAWPGWPSRASSTATTDAPGRPDPSRGRGLPRGRPAGAWARRSRSTMR